MSSPQVIRSMQRAVALHQAGQLAEAECIYRDVLQKEPRNADALQLLGLAAHQAGRNDLAVELIRKAITIRPRAEFYINLAQAQRALGRVQESLEATQRAVQMAPNIPEGWNNLGTLLKDLNRPAEAADALHKAVALRPNYAVAHANLGNALAQLGQAAEAEAAMRRAIAVDPSYAAAYSNLADFVTKLGRLDEAVQLAQRAIQIQPNLVAAYMNLGTALQLQGRLDEGNAVYARGAQLDPSHARLQENLLGGLNYSTRWTPQQSREAHEQWCRRFAPTPPNLPPHANDRNPGRTLRIGYVSPDLKRHSVAYFLEPILERHDRAQFEITAYSNSEGRDEVTDRLRAHCHRWRDIVTMDDGRAADLVHQDQIDILIDLAGHTTGNRLGLFALKPAPVQMTYLGYPNTTGLAAIDYRITDDVTDPPGQTESHYTEKLLRLPAPFLCYRPPENSPEVAEPPCLRNGCITFGSFNKAAKIGPETIALWAKALRAMPDARLMLKSRGLGDRGSRQRILDAFATHGVAADRVQLVEANQSVREHLAMYGQVDIALDTFPYHGTTTTCEAMWLGVPVVSRIGSTHVSRVGLTLLQAVGDEELAATESDEQFVAAAQNLAADRARLQSRRASLRSRLFSSRLMDATRLTRDLELLLRQAFAAWATNSSLR